MVSCGLKKEKKNFLSEDLCFWEAQGHVKMIRYVHGGVYHFDEKGNLVQVGEQPNVFTKKEIKTEDDFYYTRNSNGQIDCLYGLKSYTKYSWKNGRVSLEEGDYPDVSQTIEYDYDNKDNVSKLNFSVVDKATSEKQKFKLEYVYEELDSCGNWLTRKCICNGEESYQFRSIEYYNK